MNVPVIDEIELAFIEQVDNLLGAMTPSQIALVVARTHGQSAHFENANDLAWDLFGIWSESGPTARKIICRAMSVKLQGGSYRTELYKAWRNR